LRVAGRSEKLQAAGHAIVGSGDAVHGAKWDETRIIALGSAPVVVLRKKEYTNVGRTKTIASNRMSEEKVASDGIMLSLLNQDKPRFAKIETILHHAKCVCVLRMCVCMVQANLMP